MDPSYIQQDELYLNKRDSYELRSNNYPSDLVDDGKSSEEEEGEEVFLNKKQQPIPETVAQDLDVSSLLAQMFSQ